MNKARIRELIRELIIEIGEDPEREGLKDTPERVANLYEEIFSGYNMDSELDVTFNEYNEVVITKDIQFYSMCEHHMLPFYGKVHIAYIPNGKVFGLSKLVRLVEKFSKRLQIQERMTKQIAEELEKMGAKGVLVIAEGEHLCMKMRGVKNDTKVMTMECRGELMDKYKRENVLSIIYEKGLGLHG